MNSSDKVRLADQVEKAYVAFSDALSSRRAFPRDESQRLIQSVFTYFEATREDAMLHRRVVSHINGLREFIQVSKRRVAGNILYEADRMECMIFGGHDPKTEAEPLMDYD